MKPTGLEFHDTAFELDREIWNFKMRTFAQWLHEGKMTFPQINTCYQSWYGYQAHFDAHRALRNADRYFHSLFGVWPKHKKGGKKYGVCFNG